MKSLSVVDDFSFPGCTKSSKFEKVMIVQTHGDDREMEDFSYFFKKNSDLVQNKKNPPFFPIIAVCLDNHNFFKFGASGTTSG